MRKGNLTKEMILDKAAALFNTRGYFGVSMSDLMNATGLEKGGLYNHFSSKDELALAAFDHAVGVASQRVKDRLQQEEGSIAKLVAFVRALSGVAENPPIPGGCPLLNTAVECDDAHPEMKAKVQKEIQRVQDSLAVIVNRGMENGEIRDDVDPKSVAIVIFGSLEGGIMLTRLFSNPDLMSAIEAHLIEYISTLKA